MCSISEDVLENIEQNLMIQEENKINSLTKCNKCRTEIPAIVLRSKDAYCKKCFLISTTHKFKAELGKSKLIRFQDRVLIHYKIGHPSTSLLHFLRSGLNLDTPKKIGFEPIIIFVEDQYQLNLEERKTMIRDVNNEISSFEFVSHFVSLAKYVLNTKNINELITQHEQIVEENDGDKMCEAFRNQKSITIIKELKSLYTRNLLIDAAKSLNCKFIFTPEICVDIASNLLSNLSLGRYQVANDTGFCDDRDESIKILRPLRQFDMKELAYYNRFHNLDPVVVRETEINPFCSVQDLTNKFVKGLQKNFPATISTVIRTGDKLITDKKDPTKCDLCKVNFKMYDSRLTVHKAISISILNSQQTHGDKNDATSQRENNEHKYCYVCTKLVKTLNR